MSERTYGHVLVLPSRRLVRTAAEDDFVKVRNRLRFSMNKVVQLALLQYNVAGKYDPDYNKEILIVLLL